MYSGDVLFGLGVEQLGRGLSIVEQAINFVDFVDRDLQFAEGRCKHH